jgi:outer membrane protein TolC
MISQRHALSALALSAALCSGPSWAQQPPAPYPTPSPAPSWPPTTSLATASASGPVLQLTLEDAVKRAMENNVDIAVQRYEPQDSELAIKQARGVYDPLLSSTVSKNSQTDPARNAFSGGEKVDTDTTVFNFGAFQYIPTGGNLRLDFNNNKTDTNNVFSSFNPSFGSSLNANLAQPLLRDFKIDFNRRQITVAKKNREISDVDFRQTVVNTLANVKNLYYDLLYSIDNLEVQRKSLSLADRFLEENQIKVRVGTLAPLDVVAAESEKASREEAVILAEAAQLDAEDALKRAMFSDNNPATWATRIVPVDRPTAEPVVVDLPGAINRALAGRTDVVSARKSLEVDDINVKFTHNQKLPVFDLIAGYGATGIGGTQLTRDGLGGPVIATVPGGYGDAVSSVFNNEFPTWSVGVNFSYPLFNRTAEAANARARVSRDQNLASLHRLEMQVTAEVRSAARAVETNIKRVESTRAARVLQERRLDAETKKFAAGMSTNFLVTQSQRDLAVAEVAELRAIADYRRSLVDFERVQEAGIGGAPTTASVVTATGRASISTTASTPLQLGVNP